MSFNAIRGNKNIFSKISDIEYLKLMWVHKTGHNEGAKRFNAVSLVVSSHKLNTQQKSMRSL